MILFNGNQRQDEHSIFYIISFISMCTHVFPWNVYIFLLLNICSIFLCQSLLLHETIYIFTSKTCKTSSAVYMSCKILIWCRLKWCSLFSLFLQIFYCKQIIYTVLNESNWHTRLVYRRTGDDTVVLTTRIVQLNFNADDTCRSQIIYFRPYQIYFLLSAHGLVRFGCQTKLKHSKTSLVFVFSCMFNITVCSVFFSLYVVMLSMTKLLFSTCCCCCFLPGLCLFLKRIGDLKI